LVEKSSSSQIPITFIDFTPPSIFNIPELFNNLSSFISNSIPILFFIYFLIILRNINSGPTPPSGMNINRNRNQGNPFRFASPFSNNQNDKIFKPNISLLSWSGSPEIMEECKEVISYIENKEKFKLIGAEMPRGILLEGPPGTGKTLLAKVIATETNSTFISISGSEFVELFVGMGAVRVRELFETARANRPSIIFIDEIDAVGRQRGAGINMANDEREQTLNQLLYEMDGFKNNDDILIIAATNRKDILDQALLRPGRFDRIIQIPLPDKYSREKILEFYLKDKNINKKIEISSLADLTEGFSGAQLKNLINEAAIISARNNFSIIQENYIYEAFEKSIIGILKKNSTIAPNTKYRVAIHESGHALLAIKFKEYFEFKKASIQPSYSGAGGFTLFSEKTEIKEGGLYTKDLLKKRLIITMGGKAAESIFYTNEFVSLGAIHDLKQANNLAKKMIGNFGMGELLEVFYNENLNDDSNPFLGRSYSQSEKYSDNTRQLMDKESLDLIKEAYICARNILQDNYFQLIYFSDLLINKTMISYEDVKNDNSIILI
jgi:cell division protease FtsH